MPLSRTSPSSTTPTSNAGTGLSDHPAYAFLGRQLDLLGEDDPKVVMADTPGVLHVLCADWNEQEAAQPAALGAWSVLDMVGHMADMEWVFGLRARSILCDERPTLPGIDQDAWVDRQRIHARSLGELLDAFSALRTVNLALFQRLTEADRARVGIHAEAKFEISLGLLERIIGGHDLLHRRRLADLGGDR